MTTLSDRKTGVAKYHRELKGAPWVRVTGLAEIKYIVGVMLGGFEDGLKYGKYLLYRVMDLMPSNFSQILYFFF